MVRPRKRILAAIIVTAAAVLWLFEATMFDSRYVRLPLTVIEQTLDPTSAPAPGTRLAYAATAYCRGLLTSSGVAVQAGVAAADPSLLPVGSVVQLDFDDDDDDHDGIYSVLDTGPLVRGREIDLYMWNCTEARAFGRKAVRMTVLRLGWDPKATARGFLDRFTNPGAAAPVLPSRPLPVAP
jgi:3D (Asp-Asp-Asp) domain-containing protein